MHHQNDKQCLSNATKQRNVKSHVNRAPILTTLLALLFPASNVYAQATPAQDSSAKYPTTSSDMNHQPSNGSAGKDDLVNALINLPKKHQGKIAYDDVRAIMHKFGCVNDIYSESSGITSDTKSIKGVRVESHCTDGMKVGYVGETTLRKGDNFKYNLAINWYPSSKAECIPAEHVMGLIKADGWNYPPVNPRPGASQEADEGLSNYQPFQSSDVGDTALVFMWTLPVGSHSMMAVPIEQSCLASLLFTEHQ